MSHPRVEEVSDSDSDPDVEDISTIAPPPSRSLLNPNSIPATSQAAQSSFDPSTAKRWVCLYPIYFDITRSRQQGRRVGKEHAVENPLARSLADAVASLGLRVFFEPMKTHPKDWANVGRVKVELRGADGALKRSHVKNKHHLYIHVGTYLKAHPTTPDMPMRLPIRGMPLPEEPPGPPAIPRGWKMGTILPLHSPAVTGGGVNEDLMKDMMKDLQGGSSGSRPSTPSGSKKKDKKKGK